MYYIRGMKHLVALFCIIIFLSSCESTQVVPVDQFPIDSTVTEVELENYINRAYIAVLNRKPTLTEQSSVFNQLNIDPYHRGIRTTFIESLQADPRARWTAWQFLSNRLVDGVDTVRLNEEIDAYSYYITNSGTDGEREYWQGLLDRSLAHFQAYEGWLAADTSYTQVMRRMFRLPAYDEINMGTENFVVSVYQHAFHRYPTDAELASGISMSDYNWSTLYSSNGNSREDFLAIITAQNEFRQGMIITLFEQYLSRTPDTREIVFYLNLLNGGWEFTDLQLHLLTSTEYVNS